MEDTKSKRYSFLSFYRRGNSKNFKFDHSKFIQMEEMKRHKLFMKRCIELGELAKQLGESPVGAILVKDGEIIAEAMEASKNHNDITCHAEIEVIRHVRMNQGLSDLSGCMLYTTHEPCIMCSYVIRHHKISTIVWGISTLQTGGYSSAYKIIEDTTIKKWGDVPIVVAGVLEEECKALHN